MVNPAAVPPRADCRCLFAAGCHTDHAPCATGAWRYKCLHRACEEFTFMTFLKATSTVVVLFLGTMMPAYGQKEGKEEPAQHAAPPAEHAAPPAQHAAPPTQHTAPPAQHTAPPAQH